MRQSIDVLAAFDQGAPYPRPIRFKVLENGIKKAVDVSEITEVKQLGAGGMLRLEYSCSSAGSRGKISYKLLYLYTQHRWEIEL